LEDLGREGRPVAEAVRRMRAGEVRRQAGYDGEYGIVRMFDDEERRRLLARRVRLCGRDHSHSTNDQGRTAHLRQVKELRPALSWSQP